MQKINLKFGLIYNKDKNRVGYVFRDRFKAEPILDLTYLINCIKYVHMNPVKAGICEKQSEYTFSSYNKHKNRTFFDKELFYEIFKTEENWKYVMNDDIRFNNNFLEEKFSSEEVKRWIELFKHNFKNVYLQKNFEEKMIIGLHLECKLNIKDISEITGISHYNIKKYLTKLKVSQI